jgi:NAD(P) transhydrogenase subunit alpha
MDFQISISSFVALYIFMLAAFAGWVIIGRVPAILHTPLMSGSNFVHGIVVVGGIYALLNASTVCRYRPHARDVQDQRPPRRARRT